MNGKIIFWDLRDLADFLKAFTGSTAIFEVTQDQNTKRWILQFNEGY
jgi:hypothetical protein